MISRQDVHSLLETEPEAPVLSVFLDTSVNSENKRTYHVFLNQERSRLGEKDSAGSLRRALERVEAWLESHFDQTSRGVAVFASVNGGWIRGFQLSVPLDNRLHVGERPVVSPLLDVMQRYHHHGVVLVDREHLRILSLFMDRTVRELRVDTEPYPVPHDVKRGGYSAKDFQKRKLEEVRHFFREFADQVQDFVQRYRPDDLILLGTDENVKRFGEFLPAGVRDLVVHTGHAPVDASAAEVDRRLRPLFQELAERRTAEAVDLLRDRVEQRHMATSGFHRTLEQLQEGKVETLVIARGCDREGAQCEKCGFVLVRRDTACPYCGGEVRQGIDLAEAMVRMAAEQDVAVAFVPAETVSDLDGVGALLRF